LTGASPNRGAQIGYILSGDWRRSADTLARIIEIPKARNRTMLKNFALLLLSALIALILGELVCRAAYSPIDRQMSTFKVIRESAYMDDAQLGWVPKPSMRGEHRLPYNQISTFSTNSLGLRNKEFPLTKQDGVERIVIAGDSFAWGWGVSDGDNFPDQLGAGRSDLQVINLGVINYNIVQEMLYFERIGEQLQPDVLVLAFCENDVVGSMYNYLASRPAPISAGDDEGGMGIKRALANHSAMYRLANDVVTSNRGLMRLAVRLGLKDGLSGFEDLDYNLQPFLKQYPPELLEQWNTAMSQLLEFKTIAAQHGIRFIVAVVPVLQSVEPSALLGSLASSSYEVEDFDLDRPYVALAAFALQNGIEIIDPTAAFRTAESQGTRLYLKGDMHFNSDGHLLFAKAIADYLDRGSHP
jgi:lysophospholipase L1-like esterase